MEKFREEKIRDNKKDVENYNLEKSKSILTRAEQIKNMEDMDVIYERLENIYNKLGDNEMSKKYDKKWHEYVNRENI